MTVGSEGDGGDLVFLAGILSCLEGGPHTLLIQRSDVTSLRSSIEVERLHALANPIISIQPYITEFRPYRDGDQIEWASGGFRSGGFHFNGNSLLSAHALHLVTTKRVGRGINGSQKWLTVPQSTEAKGCVVINRTSRYQNPFFPWKEIVDHYGSRLIFIGMDYEHDEFCKAYGKVNYRQTKDFLQVAKLISSSELFIGNQSCANAIAEGLKHPIIQESSISIPDCIFKRHHAQHVADGVCTLPDISGSGELHIPSKLQNRFIPKQNICPNGGWQFAGKEHTNLRALVEMIQRMEKNSRSFEDVERDILEEQYRRLPDHFRDDSLKHIFDVFKTAHDLAV